MIPGCRLLWCSDTDAVTITVPLSDNNDSLTPKLRLIGLTLLALSATAVSHAEETRYVSDPNTRVRSGPGDNYTPCGYRQRRRGSHALLRAMPTMVKLKTVLVVIARIPLKELNTTPSLRTRVPIWKSGQNVDR